MQDNKEVRFDDVVYESLDILDHNVVYEIKRRKYFNNTTVLTSIKVIFIIFSIVAFIVLSTLYLVVPILFRSWPSFQRSVVFLNHQHFDHLLTPNVQYNLHCVHSFFLNSTNETTIGVWYIPPKTSLLNGTTLCPTELTMSQDDRLVVLYAHGSRGSRNSRTNLGNVKAFSNDMNVHVVSFDYRGFGDSIDVSPFADGLTDDIETVHRWILSFNVSHNRVLIWGHSLGSGVTVRYLSRVQLLSNPIAAVLESPFTSLRDAIAVNPLSKFFNFLPYFNYCFVEPIVSNKCLNFDSVSHLSEVRCPLLILHAEDDRVVPYSLGRRLQELAIEMQPKNVTPAVFIGFDKKYGYGHNRIHRNAQLSQIVLNFTQLLL